jgi:GT2 family glycosyltransferase
VVDNGTRPPVRVSRHFPFEVRVVREPAPGSYAARNRGLEVAQGDVLAFTDVDCLPRADWLSAAVQRVRSAGRPVMVAGGLNVTCSEARTASIYEWHSVVNDLDQARYFATYHFAATANMITTRAVFDQVGDFDPALYSGGDFEWGRRVWSSGILQVYAPEVVVRHPARADWRSLAAKGRRTIGGHYTLKRRAGFPVTAMVGMVFRMGWASIRRTALDPRLPSLACRLKVMGLDAWLRVIQLGEVARLRWGGQPRRS